MTAVIVLLVLLALYGAALRWIPTRSVVADQDRVDAEVAVIQAYLS